MYPDSLLLKPGLALLAKAQQAILMVCNISTAVIIIAAAVARLFAGISLYGYDEIILILAFWLYFMGASQGSYEDSQIKADILFAFLKSPKAKSNVALSSTLLTIIINGVFLVWGFQFFFWTVQTGTMTTALRIPVAVPQSGIFLGLALMFLYHCIRFADIIHHRRRGIYMLPEEDEGAVPRNDKEAIK